MSHAAPDPLIQKLENLIDTVANEFNSPTTREYALKALKQHAGVEIVDEFLAKLEEKKRQEQLKEKALRLKQSAVR